MATCPRCAQRRCTLDKTGDAIMLARPIGTFSLAGAGMKFSALAAPELVLTCEARAT